MALLSPTVGGLESLRSGTAGPFPDHPPYEGEHEPMPHLTVGYRRHSSLDALRSAADQLAPSLPITADVDRIHLLAGSFDVGSWHVVAEAPLLG